MKKILNVFLSVVLALGAFALASCDKGTATTQEKTEITIAMPDGAPVLAAFSLMKNPVLDGHKINFKVVSGKQNIAAVISSGEADVAVMPTNAAATLYNKGNKIKLLSVNVYGVLYMIGQTPIADMTDLYGKVVYNIGAGGTPDVTLRYIFDKNGIAYEESETAVEGKVALAYVSEASAAVGKVKTDANAYGIVGEPVATNAKAAANASVVMDIQKEWKALTGKDLPQAGVVMRENVYNDEKLVSALLAALNENPEYIVENVGEVSEVIAANGSGLKANFTAELLGRCNLKCVAAKQAKADLESYFNEIKAFDKTLIGGDLPNEGFYY